VPLPFRVSFAAEHINPLHAHTHCATLVHDDSAYFDMSRQNCQAQIIAKSNFLPQSRPVPEAEAGKLNDINDLRLIGAMGEKRNRLTRCWTRPAM